MKMNLLKRSVQAMHTVAIFFLMACSFFFAPRIVFAESESLPVMFLVDTSALENKTVDEDTPKALQRNLMERAREVFEREGLLWSGDGEEATMVVKIRGVDLKSFSYSVKIDLTYQREPVKPSIELFVCSGCSENKLVDKILERIPEAARKLFEARENASTQTPLTSNTVNSTQNRETCVPSEVPACEHQETPRPLDLRKKYRPLYITGGVATGMGAALLAAGISLAVKKDVEVSHPTDVGIVRTKSSRPIGVTLSAVGATVAVTGIAILAITAHVRNKKKSSKKVSVYPLFDPHALGMGVSARF